MFATALFIPTLAAPKLVSSYPMWCVMVVLGALALLLYGPDPRRLWAAQAAKNEEMREGISSEMFSIRSRSLGCSAIGRPTEPEDVDSDISSGEDLDPLDVRGMEIRGASHGIGEHMS